MSLLLLVTGNFFILIICLMGAQACYFKRNWKWFWLMLVCVILSSAGIVVLLFPLLMPSPTSDLPFYNTHPTTPL